MSTNSVVQLVLGDTVMVSWEKNLKSTQADAVKSNKTDKGKSKKIILPVADAKGVQPRPGEQWLCKVEKITSKSATHGAIFVRPLSRELDCHIEGVWIEPITAKVMMTVLQNPRRNLMMEGDQGVGKSTIGDAIAKTLGWQFKKIAGGVIKKFVHMLGRYAPTASGSGLAFEWIDSQLMDSLRDAQNNPRRTYLVMLDEFTRIDEDSRDALLELIEGKHRVLRLPSGELIRVGKNVVFMAAGNIGVGFTLRRQDNAARSRWVIVKIHLMPQPEELKHCMKLHPNCSQAQLDKALTIINKVRAARKDPKMRLSMAICTRGAETVAMLLESGLSMEQALRVGVVNQYSGTHDDETTEAGRVAALIARELKQS